MPESLLSILSANASSDIPNVVANLQVYLQEDKLRSYFVMLIFFLLLMEFCILDKMD
jgi:hypothetical protein